MEEATESLNRGAGVGTLRSELCLSSAPRFVTIHMFTAGGECSCKWALIYYGFISIVTIGGTAIQSISYTDDTSRGC